MASALDDIFGLSTRRNPFDLSGDTFSATGRAPSTDPSDGPNPGTVTPVNPPPIVPSTTTQPPPGSTTTPNPGLPTNGAPLPAPNPNAKPFTSPGDPMAPNGGYLLSLLNQGWDPNAVIKAYNQAAGRTTGNEAVFYPQTGEKGAIGLPGGYVSFNNGQWTWADRGPETGGGSTASNDIYTNAILSRLTQLGQPVDDPFRNLLLLSALGRSNDLMTKAPYTGQEDAALVAQYMNPLTQTRDTLRQQALERAGARGYLPSSGLLDADYQNIDKNYERNVAGASNDLAVKAVQQRQTNQDQALNILGQVEQLAQSGRAEDRQRAIDMLNTAQMLPNFDAQKLNELLQASGNGSDATSFLNSLFGANNSALNASGQNADAWGKFLGAILNNPSLMSSLFGK